MSENGTEHMEDRPPQQETYSYPESLSLPIDDIKVCGILTYGDEPYKVEFEKDCKQLQEALGFDGTYGAHSSNRINVVDSKLLQVEFFKHMMQWESEIVDAAKTGVMEKLPGLSEADVSKAIRLIYAHLKSFNACSIIDSQIARMTSLTIQRENRIKQQENIMRILDVVKERWIILERLHGKNDECALFLSTAMTLCTVPHSMMEKQFVGDDEKLQMIRYLLKFEEQLQENDKLFADNYFQDWVYARGVPIAGDVELAHIIDHLKCKLCTFSQVLTEKFIRITIRCLRRLEDRTFWFHYSGHHSFDGVQVSTDRIPLLHHTLQAAGSLVSNLVVTIDTCFADSYVETYRFTVDTQAKNSGFTVISSCCSDSEAPAHSIFTPLLIQALRRVSPVNCSSVKDQGPGGIKLLARECQHCIRFSQKCKASGTISIARIFSYITGHLSSGSQIPTIRRHYSNEQLPISRFVDTNSSFNCT